MRSKPDPEDEILGGYDFSEGVGGKYLERLKEGSNVVVLDPDVASGFDSPQEVNRALRLYLESRKSGAA